MSQENLIDAAVDAIVRGHNEALQKAVARARAEARREALEEAADALDLTALAGDTLAPHTSPTLAEEERAAARALRKGAAAIRAKIGEPKP